MYSKQKPIFPKLHKCGWCRKRLDRTMPVICREDGWGIAGYFCSEKCAKAEYESKRKEEEEEEDLNRRITSR